LEVAQIDISLLQVSIQNASPSPHLIGENMTTLAKMYWDKSVVLLGKYLGTHWEHQNAKKSNPTSLPKRKNYKPLG
jgi:hypothetical protein